MLSKVIEKLKNANSVSTLILIILAILLFLSIAHPLRIKVIESRASYEINQYSKGKLIGMWFSDEPIKISSDNIVYQFTDIYGKSVRVSGGEIQIIKKFLTSSAK